MRRGSLAELFLDVDPYRHRIETHVLACQAREEQLASVLAFEERPEHVGNLESTFVIYAGLFVTSKHAKPSPFAHFSPQIPTGIVGRGSSGCQPQNPTRQ